MKHTHSPIAQSQIELILAQMSVKEYAAHWLDTAKTVYRKGGRFAKRDDSGNIAPVEPPQLESTQTEDAVAAHQLAKSTGIQLDKAYEAVQILGKDYAQPALKLLKNNNVDVTATVNRLLASQNRYKGSEERIRGEMSAKEAEIQTLPEKLKQLQAAHLPPADYLKAGGDLAKQEIQLREEILLLNTQLEQANGGGFSLAKRIKEIKDIAEKEGLDSERFKWRLGVIGAETKYGDTIDAIHSDEPKAYDTLIKSLESSVSEPKQATISDISASDAEVLAANLGMYGSPQTPLAQQPPLLEQARIEIQNLQRMLNVPLTIVLGLNASRPLSMPGMGNKAGQMADRLSKGEMSNSLEYFNDKTIDGYINIGDSTLKMAGIVSPYGYNGLAKPEEHIREMAFHESGHIYEFKQNLVNRSSAFRDDRGAETPKNKKQPAPFGMDVVKDSFLNPYVGLKMFGGGQESRTNRATEVISSGFESLGSQKLAKEMAVIDRENMLYAISTMNE